MIHALHAQHCNRKDPRAGAGLGWLLQQGPWVGEDPVLWALLSLLCFVVCPGLVSCAFFLAVSGLYSSSDDVIELTPSNFNREVIQSNSLWLVEFYAPWYVL